MKSCFIPTRGMNLLEATTGLFIVTLAMAVSMPTLSDLLSQFMLRQACWDISTLLHQAAYRAVTFRKDVGVRWVAIAGDVTLTGYEDGNGNGVLSEDIRRGIDTVVFGPISMKGRYPSISFSFIPGFSGLDPNREPIGDTSDPIRFGRSNISTFSAIGHASPGSVYLSDTKKRQAIVRITPGSGKIQAYEWLEASRSWLKR